MKSEDVCWTLENRKEIVISLDKVTMDKVTMDKVTMDKVTMDKVTIEFITFHCWKDRNTN